MTGVAEGLAELALRLSISPGADLLLRGDEGHQTLGEGKAAVHALREHLHARYCARVDPDFIASTRYGERASGEPAFVARLAAAARGVSCWEAGWTVAKAGRGWAFVFDGKLNLFIDDRARLRPRNAEVGDAVRVRMPCARENLSPGFFHLVGRAGSIDRRHPSHTLSLNLAPAGAVPLVEALLRKPALARLRFEAKVANSPEAYCRVDTALVHVEPSSYAGMLWFLHAQPKAHPSWWRAGAPLFTRLAPAEATAGGLQNEGQQRCRMLAEEVVRALHEGERSPETWLARLASRFAREGLTQEGTRPPQLEAKRPPTSAGARKRPAVRASRRSAPR